MDFNLMKQLDEMDMERIGSYIYFDDQDFVFGEDDEDFVFGEDDEDYSK